jgi:hypothetical protein
MLVTVKAIARIYHLEDTRVSALATAMWMWTILMLSTAAVKV